MAELIKEIKTRVALRTGDYAYWTTGAGKDIVLYKGEVCICTVAKADNQAQNAPTVLFKVANANGQKFADLDWVSGLAADVYDWAKAATKPTYTANEITGLDEYIAGEIQDTNTDTQYDFAVEGGKLVVYKTLYTLGVAGTKTKVGEYDFVTPGELNIILGDYYNKGEVDDLIAEAKKYADDNDTDTWRAVQVQNGEVIASDNNQPLNFMAGEGLTVEFDNEVDGAIYYSHAVPTSGNVVQGEDGQYLTSVKTDKFGHVVSFTTGTDANTEYHVEYDSTNKKIKLVAGADASKMEIDATDFIKDGMIESVELVQQDAQGNKGQFLKLTWNDDGKDVTYVPVGELVDVYTGSTGSEVNVAISNTNVVSASLNSDVATKIANGATAHSWGDHAKAGYAKAADLGDLAAKDTVATADIDAKAVTEAKLADAVTTKLNKVWEEVGVAQGLIDELAAVAKTGSYNDLVDKPTLGNLAAKSIITGTDIDLDTITGDNIADETITEDNLDGNLTTALDKARSALQSVAADTGLKVSTKNGNSQTISIDTDVVFYFNCNF